MFWPQHMMGLGWGGWIIGGLMMLLFWGGLIALVVFTVRAFTNSKQDNSAQEPPPEETVFDILKRRYAQGEIDKAEFETIRSDLTKA